MKPLSVEFLHVIAGYSLIGAGMISYFLFGLEAFLGWTIFGAMYISMSDIGEDQKCCDERNSSAHKKRRFAAYLGATLGIMLLLYYLYKII